LDIAVVCSTTNRTILTPHVEEEGVAVTTVPAHITATPPTTTYSTNTAAADGDAPFSVSAWSVKYPWNETESAFASSNPMLNQVWDLCKNTLKVTSLDTTTDSNTRERLPYEADGYITGSSRTVFQKDQSWQLHSGRHGARFPP
jgi:hypothetical protein